MKPCCTTADACCEASIVTADNATTANETKWYGGYRHYFPAVALSIAGTGARCGRWSTTNHYWILVVLHMKRITPNVNINYQSIGSGEGVKRLTAKSVDFGPSDAPLNAEERQAAPGVVQIPETRVSSEGKQYVV